MTQNKREPLGPSIKIQNIKIIINYFWLQFVLPLSLLDRPPRSCFKPHLHSEAHPLSLSPLLSRPFSFIDLGLDILAPSMAEQKRWTWDVPGFESRGSFEREETTAGAHRPIVRRLSISPSTLAPRSELSRPAVTTKLQKLEKQVKVCHGVKLKKLL